MSVDPGALQHVVVTAATALGAAPRRLVRSDCSTWGGTASAAGEAGAAATWAAAAGVAGDARGQGGPRAR
jgi:hypothetical protein